MFSILDVRVGKNSLKWDCYDQAGKQTYHIILGNVKPTIETEKCIKQIMNILYLDIWVILKEIIAIFNKMYWHYLKNRTGNVYLITATTSFIYNVNSLNYVVIIYI